MIGPSLPFLLLLYLQALIFLVEAHQIAISQRLRSTSAASVHEQNDCIGASLGANTTGISLINCINYYYAITVQIGTPPQSFELQFDTGSNVLWLPANSSIHNVSPIFSCPDSSTCTQTNEVYTLAYADNSEASGYAGSDMLSISGTDIMVRNQILLVQNESNMFFQGDIVGIIGMGYTSLPNFLDLAFKAGQIKTNTFILAIRQQPDQSVLHYNQLPDTITSSSLYSSVAGTGYWQLRLVGFLADENDYTSEALDIAVIDSGTSLFYLNPSLYDKMVKQYLQGKSCLEQEQGGFYCPCAKIGHMPTLYFMFPGVQVNIPPSAYVQDIGEGVCSVIILTLSTTDTEILLGDTLFFQYSITFDKTNAQIGFSGDTVEITIFGGKGFNASQYVMLSFSVLSLIWALFLLYHLRMKEKPNPITKQQMLGNDMNIYDPSAQNQIAPIDTYSQSTGQSYFAAPIERGYPIPSDHYANNNL